MSIHEGACRGDRKLHAQIRNWKRSPGFFFAPLTSHSGSLSATIKRGIENNIRYSFCFVPPERIFRDAEYQKMSGSNMQCQARNEARLIREPRKNCTAHCVYNISRGAYRFYLRCVREKLNFGFIESVEELEDEIVLNRGVFLEVLGSSRGGFDSFGDLLAFKLCTRIS